jgi:hypothetical protein
MEKVMRGALSVKESIGWVYWKRVGLEWRLDKNQVFSHFATNSMARGTYLNAAK